ncbi:MAG: hypothetical protein MHMPM18_003739, partial [Marteilia pararefringens]
MVIVESLTKVIIPESADSIFRNYSKNDNNNYKSLIRPSRRTIEVQTTVDSLFDSRIISNSNETKRPSNGTHFSIRGSEYLKYHE